MSPGGSTVKLSVVLLLPIDDKMDGFGIYNYASGDVFEGDYLAGQMCGRGEDSQLSQK